MTAFQPAIAELLAIPSLVLSNDLPLEQIDRCVSLIDQISRPLTDGEAAALFELLSRSDDDMYEANWSLLHAIETAPSWPNWEVLSLYGGWWRDVLVRRLVNGGFEPPADFLV